MTKKLFVLLGLVFFFREITCAQTKKIKNDPLIWPELQADYYLKDQSYFFFRSQFRNNTASGIKGLKESGVLSDFYQIYLQAGYDQKLTEHWRAAFAARYTFDATNNNQVYLIYLQHNGKIGSFDFVKRLSYDVMNFEEGDTRGRFRPRASLEKNFKAGKHVFRPIIGYELFFYNYFGKEQGESRTVDRTRFRASLSYKISPHFWITPYFLKQTDYYKVLSTFTPELDADGKEVLDDDGNVVLIENKGGNRNRIDPIFGLELRFIFPGKNISEKTVPNLGEKSVQE